MQAQVHRWSETSTDNPLPGIARRRVIGQQMMISEIRLDRGAVVPTHAHENEQFACVLTGRLRFGLGAEGSPERCEVEVGAGEVLHLPSNVPHSAEALEDAYVLDCFSPPSEATGVDTAG